MYLQMTLDRHVFGTANKREKCYDNLRVLVSRNAWDTNLVTANPLFLAVNIEASGGGAFAVINHSTQGKLPDSLPVVNGHTAAVLDTDFNPFNDHIIASASEDCKAMVWQIPSGGLTENLSVPVLTLAGHGRKVGHVLFNPVADNILATTSADFLVKIWDISTGQEAFELTGHQEIIQSVSWNYDGKFLLSTCKDKKIRIFDEFAGHDGVKGARSTWMGPNNFFITTGFSRTSERQVCIWDQRNTSAALKQESIDTASGMLIPYFDNDTSMLYLAGKGDGNIRYFEWSDDEKGLFPLSEYKSTDPQRGIAFLPKRACAINEIEVARAYKVHPTMIEPISFKVPRKSDAFQADLFPKTAGPDPALTTAEWFAGKSSGPKLISLEVGFVPAPARDFTHSARPSEATSATAASPGANRSFAASRISEATSPGTPPDSDAGYRALQKENDQLKSRVRQLEGELSALKAK